MSAPTAACDKVPMAAAAGWPGLQCCAPLQPVTEAAAPADPDDDTGSVLEDSGRLHPGTVAFRDLEATAAGGRSILSGVTALVRRGSLCAVMGSSGSGKTTLIKALCGAATGLTITGDAAVILGDDAKNGAADPQPQHKRSRAPLGYVSQEDRLLELLSVREVITFTARMRGVAPSAVASVVQRLIEDNGLQSCADTRIGGAGGGDESSLGGISGGERRRVSLAIGLLEDPLVLCADEATSGLDASSAQQIVQLLRRQTEAGTTVLCSIHQPRQEIFEVFTHLLLISAGRLVYGGPAVHAQSVIEISTGLACPLFQNSADFIIDVCALDHTTAATLQESSERIETLVAGQARRVVKVEEQAVDAVIRHGMPVMARRQRRRSCLCSDGALGFGQQVIILTRRALSLKYRDKLQWISATYQSALFGFVLGYANFQLSSDNYTDVTSRTTLCYMGSSIVGYNIMSASLYIYCKQMPLYDSEWFWDDLYSPQALVMSEFLATLPLTLTAPLGLFCPTYLLAGLSWENVWQPMGFLTSLVLVRIYCTTIAMMYTSMSPTRSFATMSVVANAVGAMSTFTGTYIQPLSQLPTYIRWFRYVSYNYYAFRLSASAQFSDTELDVGIPGSVVLDQYDIPTNDVFLPISALLGLSTAFLLGSVLALVLLKPHPPVIREPSKAAAGAVLHPSPVKEQSDLETSFSRSSVWQRTASFESNLNARSAAAGTASLELQQLPLPQQAVAQLPLQREPSPECSNVHADRGHCHRAADDGLPVTLDGLCLQVAPRGPRLGGKHKKVLDNVCARFAPGSLTAVLGPSGAGKTTLLSVISGHAAASSGAVCLGTQGVTPSELKSNVAVVGQQDYLLPGLTVHETLKYAARLRLPLCSEQRRQRRISRLVVALGLRSCLGTIIGTQGSGGISGGERRRLSVAMACLGKPRVLLLDEPTTGLDALAAHQLITLLSKMAMAKGMTVVSTIHQPRSDLVPLFGGALLLGPGGRVLFAGPPSSLREHFVASSIEAPEAGNILDLAVDVSRIPAQAQAFHEAWARTIQEVSAVGTTVSGDSGDSALILQPLAPCPRWLAFQVVLSRSLRSVMRQREMVVPRCMNFPLFGALLVLVYAPLDDTQKGIQSRIGLLFISLGTVFAGTLNNLAIFPFERDVFLRDRADRLYSTLPFFAAYTCLEVLMEVVNSVIGGALVIYATGLETSWEALGAFIFAAFIFQFNGETIGIALNSLVSNPGFSVNAINAVCTAMQIVSGLLATSLPPALEAFNHISPIRYASNCMAITQFPKDRAFRCDGSDAYGSLGFCINNGNQALAVLGLADVGSLEFNLGMGTFLSVLFRAASFYLLRCRSGRSPAVARR